MADPENKSICSHERLDEEGYCRQCGVDMRSEKDLTPENKQRAGGSAVERECNCDCSYYCGCVCHEAYAQTRVPLIQQLLGADHRAAELHLQVAGLEQKLSLTEAMLRAKDIIAAKLAGEVTKVKQENARLKNEYTHGRLDEFLRVETGTPRQSDLLGHARRKQVDGSATLKPKTPPLEKT